MCLACGSQWPPWSRQVHVAPPPSKEETIYIDDNTQFYPDHRQGIHPPGPVYQTFGAAAPNPYMTGAYPTGMYPMHGGYPGAGTCNIPNACNYQVNGYGAQQFYYPQNGANMVPGQFPFASSPAELTAQAAAAAEHNKQIAAMSNPPPYLVGTNPADYAAQAAMIGNYPAMNMFSPGMGPSMMGTGATTLAPHKPGESNQFWCRETDGAWTLRGYSDISLGEVSPGHWEKHAVSGYFYWVRHQA